MVLAGVALGVLGDRPPSADGPTVTVVRSDRVAAGLSGATLLIVLAVAPDVAAGLTAALLTAAGAVLLATFAPLLPWLHHLPMSRSSPPSRKASSAATWLWGRWAGASRRRAFLNARQRSLGLGRAAGPGSSIAA
jgi:hypothetical protein